MRDLTLHLSDKVDFRAFLRKLDWEKGEELQNVILVDEIGFTSGETDVFDDREPEYTRNEGYSISICLLDDGFDDFVFYEWVVTPECLLGGWFQGQQMDITPILHTACTAAVQGLVEYITGDWAYGAAITCTFLATREYTQIEYRWTRRSGDDHRHKMPWWGGFDPYARSMASLMDFVVPVVTCAGLYGCMLIPS